MVLVASAHAAEGIVNTQIGILAHAEDGEQLVAGAVHAEVVAVVEIAVGGGDVADPIRGLVNRELVPRGDGHCCPFSCRCAVAYLMSS